MGEKKIDVITIGEANHDICVPGIPASFFDKEAHTLICGVITDGAGGDSINQAICMANLGEHSAFYGKLSAGYPGTRMREILQKEGVDTSLTIMAPDCLTPDIIVNVLEDGSHRFLVGTRANWGLRLEEINWDAIASARVLSIGSLFVLDSLDRESLSQLLSFCNEHDVTVVADMTYDVNHLGGHYYDDVYQYIDFLVPSWDEASYVTGETDEKKIAAYFIERGARNVIIKLGSEGSYFRNANTSFYEDPYILEPVDTTGCGDNYTAGLVHALLKGLPVRDCVHFASATGSLNALGMGASSYIRSEQMVLDFMAANQQKKLGRS